MIKLPKIISEKNSVILLWLGVILFLIGIGIFVWKESFSISSKIDSDKIAHFGDLISGVIGSVWSLAGVILFYVALTEQRKDYSTNQKALEIQVKTLNQQIEEFKLQRVELEETRKVFKEQSETLRIQRFENTFFQLINLHHVIIDNFSIKFSSEYSSTTYNKRDLISEALKRLNQKLSETHEEIITNTEGEIEFRLKKYENLSDLHQPIRDAYRRFFYDEFKSIFRHYFTNLYHIFKFIYTSDLIQNEKKQFYASILRAQLSSDELYLLFYNSIIITENFGYPKFLILIKHFDILHNFEFSRIPYGLHLKLYYKLIEDVDKINEL